MWKRTTIIALTLVLCAALCFAGRPQTILVQGQDDILVDRQAVQDALDDAQPGDTVELVGTFQFDGVEVFITKSRLTLTGRATDNDGDGEVNEDWADGVDNDGDGQVDEDDWDAVIRGLAYPDGTPVTDLVPPYTLINRAIGIEGGSGDLRGIAVRHLKFDTVLRGVEVIGGWNTTTHFCDDYVANGDEIDGVVVEKNWFDNSRRGAQVWGTVANATVRDNLATGTYNWAFLVVGDGVGCRLDDDDSDSSGVFPTDRPQRTEISGNRVLADPTNAIGVFSTDRSTVRGNTVEASNFGVSSEDSLRLSVLKNWISGCLIGIGAGDEEKTAVMDNYVAGAWAGIYGYLDSPGTRIANNTIVENDNGVYLEEASGFTLVNNEYWSSWFVDVNLDPLSHDNTVIATDFQTTVLDQGFDNKLIGTLAMIHNPGISDEVRQHLEEVRAKIAAKQGQ